MEKLISLAQVEQLIETVIKDWTPHLSVNPLLDFKKRLSSLPTEESGWIAVSPETMPEEGKDVLITDGIYSRVAEIWSDGDWYDATSGLTYEMKKYNLWKYISLPKPPLQ